MVLQGTEKGLRPKGLIDKCVWKCIGDIVSMRPSWQSQYLTTNNLSHGFHMNEEVQIIKVRKVPWQRNVRITTSWSTLLSRTGVLSYAEFETLVVKVVVFRKTERKTAVRAGPCHCTRERERDTILYFEEIHLYYLNYLQNV